MALFQYGHKSGKRFVVIFDIGSASIGGAFVGIDGENPPEIIFTTRRDIPFQEKLNFQRFLDSMIKTLEELFVLMQKAGGGVKVREAYCILASPWYASQTRLIKYAEEIPFTVTEDGLDKLITKEIALFRDSKLFVHAKAGDAVPEIMESKNIQTKLNGYEMRTPFGKKASQIEIAVFISMIPASIKASIMGSITKFWHVPAVHFSSFSFTAFDTIRSIFPDERSFLFMDISGEVTDISLARENVLLESVSFPAGKNMLIRALVDKLKTTPALAMSELDLYANHHSTPEHVAQVEAALAETTKIWQTFFQDALQQFAKEFPIPHTIFYTADDSMSEWFEAAIAKTSTSLITQSGVDGADSAFIVRSLGNAFLGKFVRLVEPDFEDPFLAIEAIFANKFSSLT
jgi:hypothetical protein